MIRDLVAILRKSLISFCLNQTYWPEVSSKGKYILFCNRMVLSEYVLMSLLWNNGLVVRAMDFQAREARFKISEWLQAQISLSFFRGRYKYNKSQELLGT